MEEPPRRETSAHKFARNLVSGTLSRPSIAGSETILGSFPSFEQHFITGSNENYCIHDGYCPRGAPSPSTTRRMKTSGNSRFISLRGRYVTSYGLKVIWDLGCGSGYKLVTYFKEFTTIGIECRRPATS
jgi:hypothetical protein